MIQKRKQLEFTTHLHGGVTHWNHPNDEFSGEGFFPFGLFVYLSSQCGYTFRTTGNIKLQKYSIKPFLFSFLVSEICLVQKYPFHACASSAGHTYRQSKFATILH